MNSKHCSYQCFTVLSLIRWGGMLWLAWCFLVVPVCSGAGCPLGVGFFFLLLLCTFVGSGLFFLVDVYLCLRCNFLDFGYSL